MECKKCKISIKGGFEPTGFHFPPCEKCFDKKIEISSLCRDCYKLFWKKFSEMNYIFINEFFEKEQD